jgi:hypothetical protein
MSASGTGWPRPKPGAVPRDVSLEGFAFAYEGEQPWLGQLDGECHLPVFSTVAKLHAFFASIGIDSHVFRLKRINDGREFLASIPPEVEVVIDPRREGIRTEYTKVLKG